ncbi:threonine/serine ThrE exporter family protein [Microbacterium album]|uniref:Membrane protein n=1 Tax=Microbacterium album TaxID=2053191 RepID=A0A917MP00_9MICO|nr:threonine/serine exporter family protein [Microbacterium album]GGH44405.1 membrane protein [Microbacterium album]
MVRERGRRMIETVRRAIHADASQRTATQALPVIDDATAVRVIDLAMRVAEVMLSVGASAKEVVLAALRITRAYGIVSVHVDVTFNSVTVSDHRHGDEWPITLMRVVRSAVPDHSKLQRLQALVRDIESGLDLEEARARFHHVRRTPFRYRPLVVVLSQALLAVGVGVMFGASWAILAVTFFAALGVALTQAGLARLQVPLFFSQIAGAFVLTAVTVLTAMLARAGIEPFVDVRASIVVSSGIVLMLAGLAVVGAAQDAIDGFSLTAGGRILELTLQTLGVVLGILVGLELARALGVGMQPPSEPLPLGPVAAQFAGAVLVAVAVAVFNGAGLRIIVVSALLGIIAWAGFAGTSATGLDQAPASFAGALVASVVGAIIAQRLHVPSVAVTTAAILPLVPGAAVFRGLLGLVEAGGETEHILFATSSLITAGMVGIALAAGATLGLFIGSPLGRTIGGLRSIRAAVGRPTAGGANVIVRAERRD